MQEKIAALKAEMARLEQTMAVVEALKPIQRQQDQCLDLIAGHIETMAAIVTDPPADSSSGESEGAALPATGTDGK